MGAYGKAEPMYRASLEIAMKVYGPDHPETAVTMNNFASLLEDKGDPRAASRCSVTRCRSAARRSATSIPPWPVASTTWRASGTLNHLPEAEVLLEHALATRRKTLGAEHVEIAGNLGSCWPRRG